MAVFANHGQGDQAGTYPNVCLGMILRTPGTEPGSATIRALQPAYEHGMPAGLFCADRGISQALAKDLHLPLPEMGLASVKHYNDDHVDRQGEFRGMQLIGGEFYCPLMPSAQVTAGASLIAEGSSEEERELARTLIEARDDYRTRIKEHGPNGDQRRCCPATGPYPTVVCHRRPRPGHVTTVDLDAPTVRTPATLAKVPKPKNDTAPYPDICKYNSITVSGTVLAKWRQKYALFSDTWQEAWSRLRSQNEGGNGNLKKGCLDSIDAPQSRLAHGRVAQTLLIAAIICIANLRAIESFPRSSVLTARKKTKLHSKRGALQHRLPTPAPLETTAPPPRE